MLFTFNRLTFNATISHMSKQYKIIKRINNEIKFSSCEKLFLYKRSENEFKQKQILIVDIYMKYMMKKSKM